MITAPLFVILLVITFVCVKTKSAKLGSVILGILLGLTLASTMVGAPIVRGLTEASSFAIGAITSLFEVVS